MTRRKTLTPARRLQQCSANTSFFFSAKDEASSSSDLNTHDSHNCHYGNGSVSLTYSKRTLHKKPPPGVVVLGSISFYVDMPVENITLQCSHSNVTLLVNESEQELAISTTETNTDSEVTLKLITPDVIPPGILTEVLKTKYLWFLEAPEEISNGIFTVNIGISCSKRLISKITRLLEFFMGKDYSSYEDTVPDHGEQMNKFFLEVKNYQKLNLTVKNVEVQQEHLIPQLRPYQTKAVVWMADRESADLEQQDNTWMASVVDKLESKCGKTLYYNKYSKLLSLDTIYSTPIPRGGILADEMGLGKTVVVIALILNHLRDLDSETNNDEYLLPVVTESVVHKLSNNFYHDKKTVELNNEFCLDNHEKLVCSNVNKGSALKRALNEWYESKLAEFSAASPSKRRRRSRETIKCLCGDISSKKGQDCVQCPECQRFQHSECVAYKENFHYFCPPCWVEQKLVKSRATLIVGPPSIYHQWYDEIKKHVNEHAFKNGVFMYNGCKEGFIQPSVLASYDVVITTYAILQAEVNHAVVNESTRVLRNEERFLKKCSPLTQIEWWRLCLDEAQMVENDGSRVNQMAKMIPAVNRWSVTGTPIQKSINDMFYLIDWLGIEPFNDKAVWNNFLYLPYMHGNSDPLLSLASKVFWRNSKEDVAEELGLPPQTVQYHMLKFTAIEQIFYMREHMTTSSDFAERLRKSRLDLNRTIDSLDKKTLTKLLAPLLNLRQACSHPLAVKGNNISTKTGCMTQTELLEYLSNKTKFECEEGMRKHVNALNGLAGLCCIDNDWYDAVENYRKVLQFAEEYKNQISIDKLQRIHTLTNLAEILDHHAEGIPPTLRDSNLKGEVKALEDEYMQKAIDEVSTSEKVMVELSVKVKELQDKFETGPEIWWYRVINFITISGTMDELMDRITSALTTNENEQKKSMEMFLTNIANEKNMEMMLRRWVTNIQELRTKAWDRLGKLAKVSMDDLVDQAVDCHLRTIVSAQTKAQKCELCSCESVLLDYECNLFAVSKKVLKEEYERVINGAQTKGSWKAHNVERVLKIILSFGRSKVKSEPFLIRDGRNHIQLLEAMKKEFKQLRVYWMSLMHQVQSRDEVSMSKLRLRLRLPGEMLPPKRSDLSLKQENKVETIYIIEHHELADQRLRLLSELDLSKSEFKKKHGTLLYLNNLGQRENPKPDPCPVCKTTLENEWCVFQCGHSYCIDCVGMLFKMKAKPSVSCPVCREITKSSDLSFVDLSGKQEHSDINVIGEHSTKVDGVIRMLLDLKKQDPRVKVLVFSTWQVVLKVLELALQQNGISFRKMPGHKYQLQLQQFKDPNSDVTVLLLPISWGSKGLNLTEATHVFLVEPILNPAEELQAVGRVHRIGQLKETIVHRFLISGTIEEKIHAAVSEAKDKWDKKKVTLEDLKNLFVMKNVFEKANVPS